MFKKTRNLARKIKFVIGKTASAMEDLWDMCVSITRVLIAVPFMTIYGIGWISGKIGELIMGEDEWDNEVMGLYDGTYQNNISCPYKIWIPQDIWHKMNCLVRKCKYELGGHLEIETKDKNIIIRGLHLPAQKVSKSSYSPSSKQFANMAKSDPHLLSRIKGWFHSHADHPVCWSHLDETTISNSLSMFKDFCLSIVINKGGEYKIRLDVQDGKDVELYDDLPLHMIMGRNKEIENNMGNVIQTNIKKEDYIDSLMSAWGEADGLLKPTEDI